MKDTNSYLKIESGTKKDLFRELIELHGKHASLKILLKTVVKPSGHLAPITVVDHKARLKLSLETPELQKNFISRDL